MAQENIKLTKKVYDKQSANDLFNMSFSELGNSNNSTSNTNLKNRLNQLFTLYNDLFYNIPKLGTQSHTTLFQQSRDYIGDYVDSKDEEIEGLIDKIVDLEQKLSDQSQPDDEHPFYRNGIILMDRESTYNLYYMDKATRRKIAGNVSSTVFQDLKSALGYKDDDSWEDVVTKVSPDVIAQIKPGPDFGPEDIGASETNVEEELATFEDSFNYNALQDGQLNPDAFYSTDSKKGYREYREYLVNRIKIVWQSEKRFEILKDKYENDKEFGFTEEERNKASILREAIGPKIRQAQETLVYYKRLWGYVNRPVTSLNEANAKNRMQLAFENFEDNINRPVTNDERSEYGGWQKGRDNFPNIDLAGLTGYTGEGGNLY